MEIAKLENMNKRPPRCYFDIETSYDMQITVAGIYYENGELVQLVEDSMTYENLYESVKDTAVYTYNGSRFDLPVVRRCLGLNIEEIAECHDLMYDCWKHNLYGGLKEVEKKLNINRNTAGLTGYDALRLWEKYLGGDTEALGLLKKYNREDVVNLEIIRKKLKVD